jgi:amino acid permease
MDHKFLKAIFLQFSGVIGAGIFALPFLFYHTNFSRTVFYLILASIVMMVLNYIYISVIVRTPGDHQLSGYAQIHLGRQFRLISCFIIFVLGFGALLAYMKLGSIFINLILPESTLFSATLVFLMLLTLVNFLRIKPSGLFFEILPLITCVIVLFIFLFSLKSGNTISIPDMQSDFSFLGALVFSLNGFTIIPEIEELLRGVKYKKALLKLSSFIGLALASVIYIIFIYAIITLSGDSISPDSVSGLFEVNPAIGHLLALLGTVVVFKSSLNFILIFKEIFYRDLGIKEDTAYFLSALVPFAVFLFTKVSFLSILSFTGSFTVTMAAVIICLMRLKLPHKISTDLLSFLVIMVFVLGLLVSH